MRALARLARARAAVGGCHESEIRSPNSKGRNTVRDAGHLAMAKPRSAEDGFPQFRESIIPINSVAS
jgi:hypothetical protein